MCHEPCFFSSFSALLILLTAFRLSFVLSDKVSLDTAEQSSVSACLISLVVTAWLFLIAEWPSVLLQTSVEMVPAGWSVADAVYTNTHVAKKKYKHMYSKKLLREKIFVNLWKVRFRRENIRGLLAFAVPKDATPLNFVEKTCANSHKTAKFAKVFSLEIFPLYGTCGNKGFEICLYKRKSQKALLSVCTASDN